MPLLQRVKIIALGPKPLLAKDHEFIRPRIADEENDYGTVTVAVQAIDAARLEMARETGDFVFMLRNSKDKGSKSIQAINQTILASLGLGNSRVGFYEHYAASMVASGSLVPRQQQIGSINVRGSQDRVFLKSLPRVPENNISEPAVNEIEVGSGAEVDL